MDICMECGTPLDAEVQIDDLKAKLQAFLEGLEVEKVDEVMTRFTTPEHYREFGKLMAARGRELATQARALEVIQERFAALDDRSELWTTDAEEAIIRVYHRLLDEGGFNASDAKELIQDLWTAAKGEYGD